MNRRRKRKVRPQAKLMFVLLILLAVLITACSFQALSSGEKPAATEGNPTSETTPAPSSAARLPQSNPPQTQGSVTTEPGVTLDAYEASAGYNGEIRTRYEDYAALYPDLDVQTVVKYVNMSLDRNFYDAPVPVDDPNSLTVLVDKFHYLPSDYAPTDLVALENCDPGRKGSVKMRAEAAAAFEKLSEDAAAQGYSILGFSGYRSYSYQNNLYTNYCKNDPVEVVDTYSARPGYSEHQLGLAIDVCTKSTAYNRFGETKEYQWALENIHKYGFVVSYPVTEIVPGTEGELSDGQPTYLHGYKLEEWHFRYVGTELAKYLYENNMLLGEYYALYGNQA